MCNQAHEGEIIVKDRLASEVEECKSEAAQQNSALQEELERKEDKILELVAKVQDLTATHSPCEELIAAGNYEVQQLKTKFEALETLHVAESTRLQQALSTSEQECAACTKQIAERDQELEQRVAQMIQIKSSDASIIAGLEKAVEKLRQEHAKCPAREEKLHSQVLEHEISTCALESENASLRATATQTKGELAQACKEREELQESVTLLHSAHRPCEEGMKQVASSIGTLSEGTGRMLATHEALVKALLNDRGELKQQLRQRCVLCSVKSKELEKTNSHLGHSKASLEEAARERCRELSQLRVQLVTAKTELKQSHASEASLQLNLERSREDASRMSRHIEELKDKVSTLEATFLNLKASEAQLQAVQREHQPCAATLAARDKTINSLEAECAKLKAEVDEQRAIAASRAQELSTLSLELNMSREVREEEARQSQDKARQLRGKVEELEVQRAGLTEQLSRLERAHSSCDETAHRQENLLEERAAAMAHFQATQQVLQRNMAQSEASQNWLRGQLREVEQAHSPCQKTITELRTQLAEMRVRADSLEAARDGGAGKEAERDLVASRQKALEDQDQIERLQKQVAAVREEALSKYLNLSKEASQKSASELAERDAAVQKLTRTVKELEGRAAEATQARERARQLEISAQQQQDRVLERDAQLQRLQAEHSELQLEQRAHLQCAAQIAALQKQIGIHLESTAKYASLLAAAKQAHEPCAAAMQALPYSQKSAP